MMEDMLNYLQDILKNKKSEIKILEELYGSNKSRINKTLENPCSFNFIKNMDAGRVNIIAELKKASPSKGMINDWLDIEKTAILYNKYKSFISAISVITEPVHFKGNNRFLKIVKNVSAVPVLRKDFIFHESQVYESADMGADAILLICSILGQKKLNRLYNLAKNIGLDVLVEAHSAEEFRRACDTGARLLGVNNRNLKNMEVNPDNIKDILRQADTSGIKDRIIICESAVQDIKYIKELYSMGVRGFLIGSYFMQSKNLEYDLGEMESGLKREGLI
jgi:indole-3-glycerol phosphate synthase